MRDLTNEKRWVHDLRTTDKPQATGALCNLVALNGEWTPGYCCLGLGSLTAGVHVERIDDDDVADLGEGTTEFFFGRNGAKGLAPREFVEWLGFTIPEHEADTVEWDLAIDWPANLDEPFHRYHPGEALPYLTERSGSAYRDIQTYYCAGLNDSCNLTFSQIADVVDYFGLLRPVRG